MLSGQWTKTKPKTLPHSAKAPKPAPAEPPSLDLSGYSPRTSNAASGLRMVRMKDCHESARPQRPLHQHSMFSEASARVF